MRRTTQGLLLLLCLVLCSCFKDEAPNAECDILTAELLLGDAWSTVFYNESDTRATITADYASDEIRFTNVLPEADLTALAPWFTISEGATIVPESGTVRDFSTAGQTYIVTSASGQWARQYTVRFLFPSSEIAWDFEDYGLSDDGKYYVWSGDWATANPGFSVANGGTDPDYYPTVPITGVSGYGVQLTTTSTGTWGKLVQKPLAAGNLFLGSFDLSTALTNTLASTHFGIPYNLKPLRFRGYYKYSPGSQKTDALGNNVDGIDIPAIYARLYRNHDADGNAITLTGEDIKTSELVIARAEVDANATDEWTYFDIEFVYEEELDIDLLDRMGYNLAVVFSSSKEGATYEGAIGSTLCIDEVSLVVEGLDEDTEEDITDDQQEETDNIYE